MTARKPLPAGLIDALLANYKKLEDLIGEEGLRKQLTKALVERALNAEMTDHLGHSKHALVANPTGNTRNGKSRKTLKGDFGDFPIEVPRDRLGTFEPQLIGKHQTRRTDTSWNRRSARPREMAWSACSRYVTGPIRKSDAIS